MDNHIQIEEIRKYRQYLSEILGEDIDEEVAARIWVMRYAEIWRMKQNSTTKAWTADLVKKIESLPEFAHLVKIGGSFNPEIKICSLPEAPLCFPCSLQLLYKPPALPFFQYN